MNDKNKIIPLIVFVCVFVIVFGMFYLFGNKKTKDSYSCYDYETEKTYTFDTEEEMHQVCDNLNGGEEDKLLSDYLIYDDIVKSNEKGFAMIPYINDDKELSIIIAISDCKNPDKAKADAKKWFSDHSYNINDYNIDYEYPCEVE